MRQALAYNFCWQIGPTHQIEAMTRGIINKIAHEPIAEMRRKANDPEGIHLIQTIRKLFRLGEG